MGSSCVIRAKLSCTSLTVRSGRPYRTSCTSIPQQPMCCMPKDEWRGNNSNNPVYRIWGLYTNKRVLSSGI
jgi:hypothetical protein